MAAPPPQPQLPRAASNTPSPPTIMQRFVLANQELARHNAKVSERPFPPLTHFFFYFFFSRPPTRRKTNTTHSCTNSGEKKKTEGAKRQGSTLGRPTSFDALIHPSPSRRRPVAQLRQELSEARRRVDVATNAEKQSYLLQRIQTEEAARQKKQLQVRRRESVLRRHLHRQQAPPLTFVC